MTHCRYCGRVWSISVGPGRVVGAIARTLQGIKAPLPEDLKYEFCDNCNVRNLTPELLEKLQEIERQWLSTR